MKLLRICTSYPYDMSLRQPAMKVLYFLALDVFKLSGFNRTYHREDLAVGCQMRIMRNESDLMPNLTPVKKMIPRFGKFQMLNLHPRHIVSAYKTIPKASEMTVFSTVCRFSAETYLFVFLLSCFVYLVFKMFRKLNSRGRRYSDFMNLFAICLHQFIFEPKANSLRIATISLFILYFYIHFYFASFIKTELVTQDQVDIIGSYEDLLQKPGVKAKWMS